MEYVHWKRILNLGKNIEYAEETSNDYESGAKMIEGLDADTVQIVSENEIKALKTYVGKNKLKVDMDSLENGTGVMILHDHKLSQKQEKQAEKAVGEMVYLFPLRNQRSMYPVEFRERPGKRSGR